MEGNETARPVDHGRYPYSALPKRPQLRWPNGARVAVWVIHNIEHYRYDLTWNPLYSKQPPIFPDIREFGWRDYGPRVGVWRLIETMDRHNLRGTVALNSDVCKLFPEIVSECASRGWELMGHGRNNSERLAQLAEEDERALIRETLETISGSTGQRPRGWLGPALTETANSPDLLAEAGVEYVCDWCNDDQPYPFTVRSGQLYSMPYSSLLNDVHFFLRFGLSWREFASAVQDAFDVLYEEGKEHGRVLPIAVHPHLSGQPMYAKGLDTMLTYMRRFEGVWWTTGQEILDWYLAQRREAVGQGASR